MYEDFYSKVVKTLNSNAVLIVFFGSIVITLTIYVHWIAGAIVAALGAIGVMANNLANYFDKQTKSKVN